MNAMKCAVKGCEKLANTPGASRGFCVAHYHRLVRYGDPTFSPPRPTRSAADRFWEKVEKTDGCWLWRGALSPQGYGVFRRGQRDNIASHRMAYELAVGSIPEGLHLDHLCRVRACVNPAHLEPVTTAENNRRSGVAVTHCPKGHEYTPENTIIEKKSGSRHCRVCKRAADARYWRSKRPSKN